MKQINDNKQNYHKNKSNKQFNHEPYCQLAHHSIVHHQQLLRKGILLDQQPLPLQPPVQLKLRNFFSSIITDIRNCIMQLHAASFFFAFLSCHSQGEVLEEDVAVDKDIHLDEHAGFPHSGYTRAAGQQKRLWENCVQQFVTYVRPVHFQGPNKEWEI